ncbi:MAG: 3-deoxy-8-phosphooctulonate synthase [Candidatus Cloacimonadota bacterium]|nr:3-deoxy-8-phosphooctulonate synthase [Candidatus Cloacimonadota bacterium]
MKINKNSKFTIIAGPCAIESLETCLHIAKECKLLCDKFDFHYIFKASYKKANRTSGKSFRGVGLQTGLSILQKVKEKFSLPILTDVHEVCEVEAVSKIADIIQIPAFLSRQTELIEAVAKTGKWVNIKKGQFMSPNEIRFAYQKAIDRGNSHVFVTERGNSFGYNNLVVDFRNFQIIAEMGIPIIYDVTHSLQRPSLGNISGGNPELVPSMTRAAVATGNLSGLFIETHPQPNAAKSDAKSMLPLDQMNNLLKSVKNILQVI